MRALRCALALVAVRCTPLRPPTPAVQGTLPPVVAEPSPGALPADTFDDRGLRSLALQIAGRTGEDLTRARLRLATAQVRAFTVAVLRARAASNVAALDPTPRFAPPAMLVEQLSALSECQPSASADVCASGLAAALLQRVATLPVSEALEPERDAVLAALAVLAPSRVPLAPEARWRVLREGEGPAARLTQAVTLWHLATGVRGLAPSRSEAAAEGPAAPAAGDAVSTVSGAQCVAAQRSLAVLTGALAVGRCSEALARWASVPRAPTPLLAGVPRTREGGDEGPARARARSESEGPGSSASASDDASEPRELRPLALLSRAGCVPGCAEAALESSVSDPLREAADACAREPALARFSPASEAGDAARAWSRDLWPRLREARATDSAVRALWDWLEPLQPRRPVPLPPPIFRAGGGARVLLPDVLACDASAASEPQGPVSALVWVAPSGPFVIAPSPSTQASHGETAADGDDVLVERRAREEDLAAQLAPLLRESDAAAPIGLAIDAQASAERIIAALRALGPALAMAPTPGAPATVSGSTTTRDRPIALAVRNETDAWFLSARVRRAPATRDSSSDAEPLRDEARETRVRVHPRGLWVEPAEPGGELRTVGWAGLESLAAEIMRPTRARGESPAAPSIALHLEPDATAEHLARALRALSPSTPRAPSVSIEPTLATAPRWWSPTPTASRASVERTLVTRARVFSRCLAGLRAAPDGALPRVDLRLSLDARGRVLRAEPVAPSGAHASAEGCVRTVARSTRWPASGAAADLVYPVFSLTEFNTPRGTP